MCTAATYKTKDFYFGRTLDYEFSYGEEIVVTPRNYPFSLRAMGRMERHYAMIGMAHVALDYPLYYEAVNEKGLGMAGLNFVGNTVFNEPTAGKDNIEQFELINWVLGQCANLAEARQLLTRLNLTGEGLSDTLPAAQLHWLIADRSGAITVEALAGGLRIYDNPVGVMTNNPPFDQQLMWLNNYMGLTPKEPENRFAAALDLQPYSRGMGALGLPGDVSSTSRFVRAAFTRLNSKSGDSDEESINQFFHILGAVEQVRGCDELPGGTYEITLYTSCCNADKGVYYYTSYENHQISGVDMHKEDLDAAEIVRYPVLPGEKILMRN
ncbi:MAG: choloylglycine hydrolase [Oscillospiraceae bacterium]|nr:choloylglycine hydrolase [Oscillospiraceae bacterium]